MLCTAGCLQQQELRAFHEKLKEALEKSRSRLAFTDLACDGFALRHSLKITAASDVVHAVTALLTEHTLAEVAGDRQSASAFWWAIVWLIGIRQRSTCICSCWFACLLLAE
jgi:hypothetical protein